MTEPTTRRIACLLPPALLGLFLVGTSGFDLAPGLGVFNGKRVLELVVLTLVLASTAAIPALRRAFGDLLATVPRWAVLVLSLAGLAGVVSALRFPHPGYGLLEVAMLAWLGLAICATAAARRCSGGSFDRLAVLIVCAVGLIAALTEFTGLFAAWISGFEFNRDIMLVRFSHPRFYNQLQSASIPLLAALPFVFGGSRKLKVAAAVLIALQWSIVLISGGRGTVVSVLAALALSLLLFPSNRRAWLGIHAGGLVLGMLLFLGVLQATQSSTPAGEGQFVAQSVGRDLADSSGRTYMWRIGLRQAMDQPLLGEGPSRFPCELSASTPAHPHSFPVTLLAEWGFPAFFLVMLYAAWLGWRLVMKSRRVQDGDASHDVLVAMLGCSIAAAAGHALLSGVLIMPASQVMVVLVGGWALGALNAGKELPSTGRRATLPILVASIAMAAWISAFAIGEVRNMEFRAGGVDRNHILEPRFWQYGHSCRYRYEDDP